MAQVTVNIDGKAFRMACEDGQESHLEGLAHHLDGRIKMMRQSFGEIGDLRLTVMAALMICDELAEEKKKAESSQRAIATERSALQHAQSTFSGRDAEIAAAIDSVAMRVDRIARALSGQQTD